MIRKRFENPVNYIIRQFSERDAFVLFINDEPAAYMAGFYSKDKRTYIVPKLSTNEDYLHLSPGIVLLVETIKLLISQGVTVLDLSNGAEPYKYAMGGVNVNTYSVSFR